MYVSCYVNMDSFEVVFFIFIDFIDYIDFKAILIFQLWFKFLITLLWQLCLKANPLILGSRGKCVPYFAALLSLDWSLGAFFQDYQPVGRWRLCIMYRQHFCFVLKQILGFFSACLDIHEARSTLVCHLMWRDMDRSEEKRGNLLGSSKLGENCLGGDVYTAGKMLM